jgi:hypothetical protein
VTYVVFIGVLGLAFAVGYLSSARWLWFAPAALAGVGVMALLLAVLWYDGRTVTGGDTVLFLGHWIDRQQSDLIGFSVLPWLVGLACSAGARHSEGPEPNSARGARRCVSRRL